MFAIQSGEHFPINSLVIISIYFFCGLLKCTFFFLKKAPCDQCVIQMKRIKAYFYKNFLFLKHLVCDPKVSPLKKNQR